MNFTYNQKIVAEYYIASLGRSPDKEGLDFWANKLDSNEMTVNQVRDMFLDKSIPEVAARFPENQDSLSTVSNIYENIFGRQADENGLNYWANRLDGSIDGFEPLGENELITIMLNTAKNPQNYIDGAYLQVKLEAAEDYYDDLMDNEIPDLVTDGLYYGTYSGGQNGHVAFNIDDDIAVGTWYNTSYGVGNYLSGIVNEDLGIMSIINDSVTYNGTFENHTLNGTWSDSSIGASGTFSVELVANNTISAEQYLNDILA
ncbi:hypothetical protein CP965_11020 [Halarcobacter mediterraneus]|uniref:DUF4214 domain-containing protein n=1 Tax=Halarcobacter mediterraneus TaxID=2023153 RepID=A0A4Q1B2Y6_9BACT|nr:DUF4214 domain-containing protein [Halarcobacter mediterraneus]RXK12289.1 hypothetical protein CP965_11020 [Halarcobacter mediterraneus]